MRHSQYCECQQCCAYPPDNTDAEFPTICRACREGAVVTSRTSAEGRRWAIACDRCGKESTAASYPAVVAAWNALQSSVTPYQRLRFKWQYPKQQKKEAMA